MRNASRKPLVMSSSVRSPLRSSSALVATVVPIFTAPMRSLGIGPPGATPSRRRIPSTAASRYASGFSDSNLWVPSVPSGRRPITSVKVPPRSIQNSQVLPDVPPEVPDMRSLPFDSYATLPATRPRTKRLVEEAKMHKIAISKAAAERMQTRLGKLHPFDAIDPRKAALIVVDMQNYFVKQGHQGEIPAAREIVP